MSKHGRLIFWLSVAWGLLGGLSHAQTLEDAIFAALENHPRIDRARADLAAAREQLTQAQAQFRPQVTFQSSISATRRDARLTDGQDFGDTAEPYSSSIQLTQPIYTSGLKPVVLRRAQLARRAERYRFQDEEIQIGLEVISAFYDVLIARERLEIQTELDRLVFAQIHAAEERFRLDVGTLTDIAQVKARHASAAAARTAAASDLGRARRALEALTGFALTEPDAPQDVALPAPTLDEVIARAKAFSPALKSAQAQYDAGRMDVLTAARRNRAQVSLALQASAARESSPAIERDDDVRATLSLTVPLLDGGANRSRRREALARRNSLAFAMQEQVLQLELFVTDLWLSHAAADAERMAQRERVAASELALEGVIKGQELGLWAVTDVLDAMEQLARARLDLVDAERRKDDLIGQLNLVSGAMAE